MKIIRTVLIAASFVVVAATANAQVREDIGSSLHGDTPAWINSGPSMSGEARGAYGKAGVVRGRAQMHDPNPLFDNFHGN